MLNERENPELPAYADGEQPDAAQLRVFRRLDEAARALPVPDVDDKLAERWPLIAQETVAFPVGFLNKLNAEAARLPVPELTAERWARADAALKAARSKPELRDEAPEIQAQRWDTVWSQVAKKSGLAPASQPEKSKRPIPVDFVKPKRRMWPVAAAVGLAASVILAVTLSQPAHIIDDSLEISGAPEVLDSRYRVQVNFVDGQSSPTVCFYLKPEAGER